MGQDRIIVKWKDLTKKERRHLKVEANVTTLAGFKRTAEAQRQMRKEGGEPCYECKNIARRLGLPVEPDALRLEEESAITGEDAATLATIKTILLDAKGSSLSMVCFRINSILGDHYFCGMGGNHVWVSRRVAAKGEIWHRICIITERKGE